MKHFTIAAATFFGTMLFVYLAGCFGNAGFDISHWAGDVRGLVAYMGLGIATMAGTVVYCVCKGIA